MEKEKETPQSSEEGLARKAKASPHIARQTDSPSTSRAPSRSYQPSLSLPWRGSDPGANQTTAILRTLSLVGAVFVLYSWFRLNYFEIPNDTFGGAIRLVPEGFETLLVVVGVVGIFVGVLIGESPRWGALAALLGIAIFTMQAFSSHEVAGVQTTIGAEFTPIWFVGVAVLGAMLFVGKEPGAGSSALGSTRRP